MTISRERFEQGMTYDQYKARMEVNRERFEDNERTVTLSPDDVAFFQGLPAPLNVAVLTEDWCGDAVANVPVLVRLAQTSGTLNLRFFLRDQNLDIMDQYLNRGEFRSIPTFVFMDQDFNEIGHWIERPAVISQMQGKMIGELWGSDKVFEGLPMGTSPTQLPEAARMRLMQAFGAFRAQTRDLADREVVREVREVVEHGLVPRA